MGLHRSVLGSSNYHCLHGFQTVVTRFSAKSECMSDISEEIRKYFSELIKPLATNTSLREIFDKMKEEVISKFD